MNQSFQLQYPRDTITIFSPLNRHYIEILGTVFNIRKKNFELNFNEFRHY